MKSIKAKKISDKITARHCTFNNVKFDSLEERDFYVKLLRCFGESNVSRCGRVEIMPSTKNLPAIAWDVDFKVQCEGVVFMIEYKGLIQGRRDFHREFFLKLNLLKRFSRNQILVFSPDSIHPKWQTQDGLSHIPGFFNSGISDTELKNVVHALARIKN